jgi:uncharacterized membrane protein YeaQ/YmgE (transglycosylase-associated protein family)
VYTFFMGPKMLIYLFLSVGSFVGGWIPTLWGASALGLASIIGAFIGGTLGIWAGFKLSQVIGG